MDIEIKEYNDEGFMPLIVCNKWRVALINSAERLLEKNLSKIERHIKTDEVFVLLSGKATLFIGKEKARYEMEQGKIYNVKCGVWHAIALEEETKVLVIEDADTEDFTERIYE